jgi:hypothetical protein
MAQVASLAIRAGFSAMIVPNATADKRDHEQKRGQYGANLYRSNCPVLPHSERTLPFPRLNEPGAALETGTSSVLQTHPQRKWLHHMR